MPIMPEPDRTANQAPGASPYSQASPSPDHSAAARRHWDAYAAIIATLIACSRS
jgi:hypothetical protein